MRCGSDGSAGKNFGMDGEIGGRENDNVTQLNGTNSDEEEMIPVNCAEGCASWMIKTI